MNSSWPVILLAQPAEPKLNHSVTAQFTFDVSPAQILSITTIQSRRQNAHYQTLIKHLEWWRCLLLLWLIEVGIEVIGWSAILRAWLSVDKARVYIAAIKSTHYSRIYNYYYSYTVYCSHISNWIPVYTPRENRNTQMLRYNTC